MVRNAYAAASIDSPPADLSRAFLTVTVPIWPRLTSAAARISLTNTVGITRLVLTFGSGAGAGRFWRAATNRTTRQPKTIPAAISAPILALLRL